MDSITFTLSKQAANPLVAAGPPAPEVNNKPPYNKMHMALGSMQHVYTIEHSISTIASMNSWSIEGPTPHAPERYRVANINPDSIKLFF